MKRKYLFLAPFTPLFFMTSANAALPDPVRAMIDTALESGNISDVEAVAKVAKITNPDDAAEIDALLASFRQEQIDKKRIAETKAAKENAEQLAAKEDPGFFDDWSGQGQLGGFRSTGNTSSTGFSAGLKLAKEEEKWRLKFRSLVDYQRTAGVTSREQFSAILEPNYKFDDKLYAYGLAQYERDRFQGFSSRYTVSGGLGYTVINANDISLNVKAGPAYRITEFIGGGSENSLAALLGLDFNWKISDRIKFSQDAGAKLDSSTSATAIISSRNSTLNATTALDAKLMSALSARVSYTLEYESSPPAGTDKTDTLSRISIIYDF